MKKKSLKKLSVNKHIISTFSFSKIKGGKEIVLLSDPEHITCYTECSTLEKDCE